MLPVPRSTEIKISIPFHDLDPMHVVWHGNYMKYFDIARFELFNRAGIDLYGYSVKHQIMFPVTRSSTKHIIALRHRDEVICRATVSEAVYKIVIDFEIRRADDGQVFTRGRGEQVAVKVPEMELMFEIPTEIRNALGY
mgnify:CR=1 FL=1